MSQRLFITPIVRHQENVQDSATTTARPAWMGSRDGRVPAVAIFRHDSIRSVFTIPDALRVANEIADAIAKHNQINTQEETK